MDSFESSEDDGGDNRVVMIQDAQPFQFDRILRVLKQNKQKPTIVEQDAEAMSTRSGDSGRIQASTLIKHQQRAEDERKFLIQRLKKWSLFLLYIVLLGLALHDLTGFGANCKRDQHWSIFAQQCDCNKVFEENKKGVCVPKCSHYRWYNVTDGTCHSCDNSWQHVEYGNVCSDRCHDNLLWYEEVNDCGNCPDFWQWVLKDNKCVNRCQNGKSYNRYFDDENVC